MSIYKLNSEYERILHKILTLVELSMVKEVNFQTIHFLNNIKFIRISEIIT